MVALLSVCTAGVSTFAWFQAQANVNVSTTSSTTTITVAKPDETMRELFVFKDNYAAGGTGASDAKKTTKGAVRPAAGTIAFDGMKDSVVGTRQFYRLTSASGSTYYTSTASFAPGETVHFAVLIHEESNKARKITGATFASASSATRLLYKNGTTTKQFSLALAINIYSMAIPGTYDSTTKEFTIDSDFATDGSYASAADAIGKFISGSAKGSDKFDYDFDHYNTGLPSGEVLSYHTQTTKSTLFLYTIEFSNGTDTWYTRVTDGGAVEPTSPTDSQWASTTYWAANPTTGDSEVFQGLTFNITSLLVGEYTA